MDALRNSKKISLLAEAILFWFKFFNLILDARRTWTISHYPKWYDDIKQAKGGRIRNNYDGKFWVFMSSLSFKNSATPWELPETAQIQNCWIRISSSQEFGWIFLGFGGFSMSTPSKDTHTLFLSFLSKIKSSPKSPFFFLKNALQS